MITLSFQLTTDYPFWFIIICILTGIIYAAALYVKETRNEFSSMLKKVLAIVRFIAVSLIAFLLLSPLIKTATRFVEKPIIIIAQDHSQSIVKNKDSLFYKTDYVQRMDDLIETLKKNFDVKPILFGDRITDYTSPKLKNYTDKETDIAAVFEEIETNYSGRNVGAVIIASDGLYNNGPNPLYSSRNMKIPVYAIALGDTTMRRDCKIIKVNHNRFAYLGNTFPLEIVLNAAKCKGLTTELKVMHGNETVFTKIISFSSDVYNQTIPVQLEAKQTGIQHYKISIVPVKDEVSIVNNESDVFIEVLNNKQKILIVGAVPHPDLSAIKQSIEKNTDSEVTVSLENDFNNQLAGYNLIILHQIPSLRNPSTQLISSIIKNKIPVLYIIGTQTNLISFNALNTGLTIINTKNIFNESQASNNKNFSQFTLSPEIWRMVQEMPPLTAPFGQYKTLNSANVLFYQKIGSVISGQPLVLFNQTNETRNGIIAGEGLWRWRLNDFLQKTNHAVFDELISKIVQYLSVKEDKGFFKIFCEHQFQENQQVEMNAEVYNDSYELINEPDVELTIINREGKNFPFTFTQTAGSYHLNADIFPVGVYSYVAKTKVGTKLYEKKGEFIILPLQKESINTTADHKLLFDICKKHDGELFYPMQTDALIKKINERQDIRSVSYSQKRYRDMINLPWIMFLIVALLTTEWFLRKNKGGY